MGPRTGERMVNTVGSWGWVVQFNSLIPDRSTDRGMNGPVHDKGTVLNKSLNFFLSMPLPVCQDACLFLCLIVHTAACLFLRLSDCPYLCLSVSMYLFECPYLACLSVCLFACLIVGTFTSLSICFCLFICLIVRTSVCLFACLIVHTSACLSACIFTVVVILFSFVVYFCQHG